jgi:uncharacterized protein YkwD
MVTLFTRSLGLKVAWSYSLLPLLLLLCTSSCKAEEPGDELMFSRTKLLRSVNNARSKARYCGTTWYKAVKAVKWNEQLELAAREHSKDMFDNQFFSHTGSDGKNVDDRIYSQHYFWTACGENVAYGALYEDEVMKEWLNSPGHCANIMNPAYTEMGAWLTGMYWTQVFAKPQ